MLCMAPQDQIDVRSNIYIIINGRGTTLISPGGSLHLQLLLVGCKHRASESVFYIGGRGFVCQIIEPVTFARLYLNCGISHWADI